MPKNLLLADDSITMQKVVGITFANEDFKVTSAANGEEALAKARELRPDVILADVVMPRKNGYELCEALKSDPALRHIPVLLLAGTFEAFDEARARHARADGHVSKPFDSGTLIAKVKELVDGRSAAGAAAAAPRPAAPAQPQPQRPAGAPAPAGARPPGPGMPPQGAPRPGAMPPGAVPPGARLAGPGAFPPGVPRPGAPMPMGARPPGPGMPSPGARPPGPGAFPPGGPRPGAPMPMGARPPGPGMPPPGGPRPGFAPQGGMPPPGARPPAPGMMAPPAGARPPAPGTMGPLAGAPRPAPAPARAAPVAAPRPTAAPAAKSDPFGFGLEVPRNPPPAAPEEDFGDIDVEPPVVAAPQVRAPIELPEEPTGEPELAPMHAFVPPADKTGHVAERAPDGGETVLREALSQASREVIERVVWEVVPQLAETIIRENLERLVRERQG